MLIATPPLTPATAAPAVSVRDVRKVFDGPDGQVVAIERMSLSIPRGQFVSLLGPSGCGKSTLLRIIAGLDRATEGVVERSASARDASTSGRRDIAFVFQDAHLLPWRNVLRNVALPLELAGVSRADRRERAMAAIEQVGLKDAARRYPLQLSGGMRMRASIARALVTEPDLLLLDEPFAALDEITRQQLDDQLLKLWHERKMTTIFVTHGLAEATYLSERVLVFARRPARIVLDHTLNLPRERTALLRTDPQFAAELRVLFEALDAGQRGLDLVDDSRAKPRAAGVAR
jgi:NitT/TauT family transport system ATP-binding protein